MKFVAILVLCTLINNYVQSAPAKPSILADELDGVKPKYLLMTIGPGYSDNRKLKWIIVYKNVAKKECVFREVDDSIADALAAAAANLQKKSPLLRSHLDGLLIIDDTNISHFCDGFSTRFLPVQTANNATVASKENS